MILSVGSRPTLRRADPYMQLPERNGRPGDDAAGRRPEDEVEVVDQIALDLVLNDGEEGGRHDPADAAAVDRENAPHVTLAGK